MSNQSIIAVAADTHKSLIQRDKLMQWLWEAHSEAPAISFYAHRLR